MDKETGIPHITMINVEKRLHTSDNHGNLYIIYAEGVVDFYHFGEFGKNRLPKDQSENRKQNLADDILVSFSLQTYPFLAPEKPTVKSFGLGVCKNYTLVLKKRACNVKK